jgi:UTP--glucose-1-phosphate uridylyltransferase
VKIRIQGAEFNFMAQKVRKAIFPAAGLGTRFLPATKAMPKEMLPIVDKPLIQYGVEECVASGIESILFITARGKSLMEDHFDVSFELEATLKARGKDELLKTARAVDKLARIHSVRQQEPLGLGHAILQARDFVGNEPFAALLPDDVIDAETPVVKQMIAVYEKYDAPVIATMQIRDETISRFGVIDAEEVEPGVFKVRDMVEKPPFAEAPSDLAIIGRYILTPDIFAEIERTPRGAIGEIQITDAMRLLLKKRPFYALRFEGTRYDAGDKLGFLIANVAYALKREDVGEEFRAYLKKLAL